VPEHGRHGVGGDLVAGEGEHLLEDRERVADRPVAGPEPGWGWRSPGDWSS
jgi:hypothetical protein